VSYLSVFDTQVPVLETPYLELDVRAENNNFSCVVWRRTGIFRVRGQGKFCRLVACSKHARYQCVHTCSAVNGL
jgi:hypothetical protein